MIQRRSFLTLIGLGPVAAVAPAVGQDAEDRRLLDKLVARERQSEASWARWRAMRGRYIDLEQPINPDLTFGELVEPPPTFDPASRGQPAGDALKDAGPLVHRHDDVADAAAPGSGNRYRGALKSKVDEIRRRVAARHADEEGAAGGQRLEGSLDRQVIGRLGAVVVRRERIAFRHGRLLLRGGRR